MLERADIERVDELGDRRQVIAAGNTDECDGVAVLIVYLCDRRGFCSARGSPGGPEPKDHVAAFK